MSSPACLIGEPDAGNPQLRSGQRGGQSIVPTLFICNPTYFSSWFQIFFMVSSWE